MSDLLQRIRADIDERLAELRPFIDEYESLNKVMDALGSTRRPTDNTPSRRAPRGQKSAARPARSAEERRADRSRLVELASERPGVTKDELRSSLGLSAGAVAQLVRRLTDGGELEQIELPGGESGLRVPRSSDHALVDAEGSAKDGDE